MNLLTLIKILNDSTPVVNKKNYLRVIAIIMLNQVD